MRISLYVLLLGCIVFNMTGCAKTTEVYLSEAIIADFNEGTIKNNLGGESGTWMINPDDPEQFARASLDSKNKIGKKGASLKLEYDIDSPLKNTINGFWTVLRSFDASGYDHLVFWIKGDKEKGYPEKVKIEFKKVRKNKEGRDETIVASYIVKGVTDKWQRVSIPLNVMNGILDWHGIKEFVIKLEDRRLAQKEGVLYFDDIKFVKTGNPGPSILDIVPHKQKKADLPVESVEYAEFLIKRLKGFPEEVFVKKTFPEDDREFLMEIAKDTWGYFDNIVDKEYSLPLDNIWLPESDEIYKKGLKIGDYTNITNIGLYLMCIVSGYDFGFITKEEAVKRLDKTLKSLNDIEKYKGFPYNYYDITIFQRTSNFISFVDSGWLAAGLIVAKNAFPEEIGDKCIELLDNMDFSFFYDPVEGHMYAGFYSNIDYYSEHHYGTFYSEPRAISYIAIGKGDVPKEHWFMLARTFPDTWLWQTQMPKDRREKVYLGYPTEGGYYTYEDIKFVPSWGGSMFEALMPTIIIDEKGLAPLGLGLNDERHALIQIKYAFEKLNYDIFGFSPCSIPGGGYREYGVKPLGMKGYDSGLITPHASFLALEFTPKESIKNLRTLLSNYDIYGEYGFYDAVDPETKKVATMYLCLDQAMSFISLNNYLNDGAIKKRFHADPIAKNAEELLKVEDFFN